MIDEILDNIAKRATDLLFSGNRRNRRQSGRQRIVFDCGSGAPYEAIQYLESLGVKCWPGWDIHENDDGSMRASVKVNSGQYDYAAGLIAGYPGMIVLEPHPVKPIKPSSRWGTEAQRAQGVLATTLRGAAGFFGTKAKIPPTKGKRR